MTMKTTYEIGSALDVGLERKGKPNQDSIGMHLPGFFNRRPPLLVLSDGMGAYGGGEVASRLAVDAMLAKYRRSRLKSSKDCREALLQGVQAALQAVTRESKSSPELEFMGCTIVAAILFRNTLHITNVGDSRAYLASPAGISQISYDHSLVAEQLRLGLITEAEARTHPKLNVLSLSLSARRESVEPYLNSVPWNPGETLLLCSDGLWGPVTEAQIHAILMELEPQRAADKLVQLANTNQGPDNISVIIARRPGTAAVPTLKDDDTGPGV